MSKNTIIIASDHAGFERKTELADYLASQGYEILDLGPDNGENSIDYPLQAEELAHALQKDELARGILVCGSGIGFNP